MADDFGESILHVCSTLNECFVEYLVVGGAAVGLHGYFRGSTGADSKPLPKPDLDIWYNPTYDNYYKLLHALKQMGRDVVEFENEETPNPKTSFFRYTLDLCTIYLLLSLKSGLAFRRCFVNRKVAYFDQVEISFLGLDDLITDKMHDARPKDLDDLKHIKKER